MCKIRELLIYQLALKSLYLTKEDKLRKSEKHNPTNAIVAKHQASPHVYVPIDDKKHNFVFLSIFRKQF